MPYIKRDTEGRIEAVFRQAPDGPAEVVAGNDPELLSFLTGEGAKNGGGAAELLRADLDFIRVLEDLIDVLLKRDLIAFTDLPPEAQRKLLSRQATRSRLQSLSGLIEAEDDDAGGPF